MSNLKHLTAYDHGIRTEEDYLRVFASAFSTNMTAQGKSMEIAKFCTRNEQLFWL